ncbi:glutamate 5-kinase [Caldalkalibacillus uzonensis]|uniref:Glutamate 5-kinase n=1 Tax=Caldalkalibacillus uzonensis TaxID=353224 RepID=A0ABU0CVN9_9BACI|nr:glutamate 5-kinase [Caldalkalibacillus uzonensis]MDQ0340483.1 glutamate 5-kinase [Caldalkalibacillus uzonensis]
MGTERIVVKIGSSSLTTANGGLCEQKLNEHVQALARLKQTGYEVILISSGAVAAGFTLLGYPTRPVTIKGKQAAAAVGQGLLMQGYTRAFAKHGIVTAQLLLTRYDFADRERYNNAYRTLTELLAREALPIINENDSVAVDELTFGDNDMLSALVSGLIHADWLIILTDIDGLYDADPRRSDKAKKYTFLPEITADLLTLAGEPGSKVGTGGMRSKLEAAQMALSVGAQVFIGKGEGEDKLLDVIKGKGNGTYIGSSSLSGLKNRQQWIAFHSAVKGAITVDQGAATALLERGKSLLPAGITQVQGNFQAGEVVEVLNHKGERIGKGVVNYTSSELQQIKGKSSREAMQWTRRGTEEVIHRDNWVSLGKERIGR